MKLLFTTFKHFHEANMNTSFGGKSFQDKWKEKTHNLCPPFRIINSDKIKLKHEVLCKFCEKIDAEAGAALPVLPLIPGPVHTFPEMRQHLIFHRCSPVFFSCWHVIRGRSGHLFFSRHLIPRSTLHFHVTGSGLARLINGGSSKLVSG